MRMVKTDKEKPCAGCPEQIEAGTECSQELWYSGGGPYLLHRHKGCVEVTDEDVLQNTVVDYEKRRGPDNGLADIEAAFCR